MISIFEKLNFFRYHSSKHGAINVKIYGFIFGKQSSFEMLEVYYPSKLGRDAKTASRIIESLICFMHFLSSESVFFL